MTDFLDQTGGMPDAGKDPSRPNILLICTDQLRADYLGCNGHPIVQTPQIDKLAAAGVNFRRAFSECPVCVPARRILMTGLNPYHIHMRSNKDTQPFTEGPKLAELFTREGYQTFAAGKLHTHPQRNRIGFEDVQLNEEGRKQGGLLRDDYETYVADAGYPHMAWTHGLGNNQYGMRINPLPEHLTTTHWTGQKAMEFIERRDPTRPFFLYVSFDKPHPPIIPSASYYELYRDAEFALPVQGEWLKGKTPERFLRTRGVHYYDAVLQNRHFVQQTMRGYAAMITQIDSMIGSILGTLRENGLFSNTWIVFTADHGDQLFDHGNFAKSDFFRGSTSVPMIVHPAQAWRKQQGFVPGREDTAHAVGLADLMPTLLDAAGLAAPAGLDGSSLLGVLKDPAAAFRPFTFGACNENYGVSDGRHKYMWFSDDDLEFLFDLENDPGDCHDLSASAEHRPVLERLRGQLTDWMARHGDEHISGTPARRVASPSKPLDLAAARAVNTWNNRGRH